MRDCYLTYRSLSSKVLFLSPYALPEGFTHLAPYGLQYPFGPTDPFFPPKSLDSKDPSSPSNLSPSFPGEVGGGVGFFGLGDLGVFPTFDFKVLFPFFLILLRFCSVAPPRPRWYNFDLSIFWRIYFFHPL